MSSQRLGTDGRPLRGPVVYLDTSTLGDAYSASDLMERRPGIEERRELFSLVYEIAQRGTLCYSVAHVIETVGWQPREAAVARGAWLDHLPHAWIRIDNAEANELIDAVRERLGRGDGKRRLPIYPAFLAAVQNSLARITPETTIDLLAAPTIAGYIEFAHGKLNTLGTKEWSTTRFEVLRADRAAMPPGTTAEDVYDVTFEKFTRALKAKAISTVADEPILIGSAPPTDAEIGAVVDALLSDPKLLPMNRIVDHAFRGVGGIITRQQAGSARFARKHGSLLWDMRHGVAGGFADVFTCDEYVDDALGNFRTLLGLPRQLSIGGCGSLGTFVAALRRQFEQAAASL